MRRVLLRSLVALLAVALVASGATAQQCFAATAHQLAAAAAEAPHHAAHSGHAMHMPDGRMAAGTHEHGGAPEKHDHSGLNCCAMCTTPTMLTSSPLADVVFAVAAIEFSAAPRAIAGHTVRVDPGIPKTPV